jgi:hypothetical protein
MLKCWSINGLSSFLFVSRKIVYSWVRKIVISSVIYKDTHIAYTYSLGQNNPFGFQTDPLKKSTLKLQNRSIQSLTNVTC